METLQKNEKQRRTINNLNYVDYVGSDFFNYIWEESSTYIKMEHRTPTEISGRYFDLAGFFKKILDSLNRSTFSKQ